jgi:hypothetical protein
MLMVQTITGLMPPCFLPQELGSSQHLEQLLEEWRDLPYGAPHPKT